MTFSKKIFLRLSCVLIIKWFYLSAFFTPDQSAAVTGGMNLKDPVGGEAYGIPLKISTGSKFRPSKCKIVPETAPYFVCTILDVICAWSFEGSLSSPPHEKGSSTDTNQTIDNIVGWFPRISKLWRNFYSIFHSHILIEVIFYIFNFLTTSIVYSHNVTTLFGIPLAARFLMATEFEMNTNPEKTLFFPFSPLFSSINLSEII